MSDRPIEPMPRPASHVPPAESWEDLAATHYTEDNVVFPPGSHVSRPRPALPEPLASLPEPETSDGLAPGHSPHCSIHRIGMDVACNCSGRGRLVVPPLSPEVRERLEASLEVSMADRPHLIPVVLERNPVIDHIHEQSAEMLRELHERWDRRHPGVPMPDPIIRSEPGNPRSNSFTIIAEVPSLDWAAETLRRYQEMPTLDCEAFKRSPIIRRRRAGLLETLRSLIRR